MRRRRGGGAGSGGAGPLLVVVLLRWPWWQFAFHAFPYIAPVARSCMSSGPLLRLHPHNPNNYYFFSLYPGFSFRLYSFHATAEFRDLP